MTLTDQDHLNMDLFIGHVLDAFKTGELAKADAVGHLAHVMVALADGNHHEASRWFQQGRKFMNLSPVSNQAVLDVLDSLGDSTHNKSLEGALQVRHPELTALQAKSAVIHAINLQALEMTADGFVRRPPTSLSVKNVTNNQQRSAE